MLYRGCNITLLDGTFAIFKDGFLLSRGNHMSDTCKAIVDVLIQYRFIAET